MTSLLSHSAVWGTLLTIAAYGTAVWLQRRIKKSWCNPLLLCVVLLIAFLAATKIPCADYRAGASPISWLLLPATVCLAIPLYEKLGLLRENLPAILAGIAAGAFASLGSVLAMAWVFRLEKAQAVTLLPKSVTTAIGMDVASSLGGIPALAGAIIILTGIVGNLSCRWLCRVLRITDPVAKGIAIGTGSHAIGTAKALELGEVEGAMSGLAVAVAGILTAVLAPLAAQLL